MINTSRRFATLLSALAFLAGAAPTGHTQPVPTRGAPRVIGTPTFYRDVLPILQQHCQSCHRSGEIGPMPLVTYENARACAQEIANFAGKRKMPPWFADPRYGHFSNDPSLTTDEIQKLVAWADANAPAGDPKDAPPPRQWVEGWNIPQP